jgi:type III pantothenate kinase
MPMTVLALNIGNTTVSAAVFQGRRIAARWSAPASRAGLPSFRTWLDRQSPAPRGAMLASVVPARTGPFLRLLKSRIPATFVLSRRSDLGIPMDYPGSATLGADRRAALCEASARFSAPLIVIDAGTAITFNAIVPRRGFIGGVIAPGPGLFTGYLAERTAQLPRLPAVPTTSRGLGRTTRDSMRIGAATGFEGMIRGIVARLRETPALARARLIVTGGGAAAARKALRGEPMTAAPDLVLRGLARAWSLRPSGRRLP